MAAKLSDLWDKLRTSYWFVPLLMTLGAVLLATGLNFADTVVPTDARQGLWFLYQSNGDQARALLLAIAAGTLGLIGAVLSITMVPLTIAAAQLGPRLLRTFLRDTPTQLTIGVFCGSFVYCTLLALSIPSTDQSVNVPRIAITVGLLLPLLTIVMLITFIHHISVLIQAPQVIAEVGADLEALIKREFPDKYGAGVPANDADSAIREQVEQHGAAVCATFEGYVHAIDRASLLQVAANCGIVLLVKRLPGDFVARGDVLALALPANQARPALAETVNQNYVSGGYRTLIQDVEFGINSLVEVALRALSPAINDPLTAMACLDRLGAALGLIVQRSQPPPSVYDAAGTIRLIIEPVSFDRLLDAALHPIRQYGRGDAEILIRMLRTIAEIGARAMGDEQRQALLRHAALIEFDSRGGLPNPRDQQRVLDAFRHATTVVTHASIDITDHQVNDWPSSA